jgi:SAM-dependent methyltransferase
MADSWGGTGTSGIGEMLLSCRSLAEYRGMFALSDDDLRGRVLDCPGGAASFTADASELGCEATACDPIYLSADPAHLAEHARRETARANAYVQAHPGEYTWTFFRDPDHHRAIREASAQRFAADLVAHPVRYVPGALPQLPFDDGTFDLALSSHFLFSYADRLDEAFHLAALRELARVAAEVRVFPLVPMGSADPVDISRLRVDLVDGGLDVEVRPVEYEFQRGGREMLVCRRSED